MKNTNILRAQRIKRQQRAAQDRAALAVANRYHLPKWDIHAIEMRDTIKKLVQRKKT
jgi:hypothetical protein